MNTDKGRLRVPAARFEAADAIIAGGQPLESAAHSRLQASPTQVWAGAVFNLAYTIEASRSYYPDFGHGAFDWNPEPLVTEDWSHPEPFEIRIGSDPKTGLNYRTRALAHKPGSYHLNPASQLVNLSVGVTGFGFFQQRQYQQFSVTSDAPTIDVRPLPPAPEGFSGAVGDFTLASPKSSPPRTRSGRARHLDTGVERHRKLARYRRPAIAGDFQRLSGDRAQTQANAGGEETLRFEIDSRTSSSLPTKSGPLRRSGRCAFTYFDPEARGLPTLRYRRLGHRGGGRRGARSPAELERLPMRPAAPPKPAKLGPSPLYRPRDFPAIRCPRARHSIFRTPTVCAVVVLLLDASRPAPPAVALAWPRCEERARTDPARPRREARIRLAATLAKLRSLPPETRPARDPGRISPLTYRHLETQSDAAVLRENPSAAPVSSALPNAAWSALWAEADRRVYSARESALPSDWIGAGADCARRPTGPGLRS